MKSQVNKIMAGLYIIIAVLYSGCSNDKEELLYPHNVTPGECSSVPAKFSANIKPLVLSKCAISGCHDFTFSGGLSFFEYIDVSSVKDRILQRVVNEKSMPPTGPLPQADIDKLKCWIEAGALDN